MTVDYSRFRSLARALRGDSRPNPLKLVAGTALPPRDAEPPATLPDIDDADDDDLAPPPSRVLVKPEAPPAPATPYVNPVDTLMAALDAAGSDMERGYLLAAAPLTVRESLSGALAYSAMVAPQPNAALDALTTALDNAVDDAQRAALLSTAPRELRAALADRLWWRRVSADDAQLRYLAMIR